MDLKDLNEP